MFKKFPHCFSVSYVLKPSPNKDTLVSHCSMTCVYLMYLLSLFLQPAIYIRTE